jgi:hypothetical protein
MRKTRKCNIMMYFAIVRFVVLRGLVGGVASTKLPCDNKARKRGLFSPLHPPRDIEGENFRAGFQKAQLKK